MARFHQGRYREAARLLEKVCKLEVNDEGRALEYSYLGRCYLALGQHQDALDRFSRAYEPMRIRSQTLEDEFARQEYVDFLHAFSNALRTSGQPDRAQQIYREAHEYIQAMKERKD